MLRRIAAAWLTGIRFWNPPHAIKTEFLVVWAVLALAAALLFPYFLHWAGWLKGVAAVVFLLLAGFVNYGIYLWSKQ
ncbi:MAG: hypothetical protein HY656_01990 [Acidobacteria bacterium]|nr:hypothetical protein [Acidobacteriota bacterium]